MATILVVDDNDAMREVAAMQLQTLGYEVIVASDAVVGVPLAYGDEVLARWGAERQADLFRRAFGRELSVA